MHTADFDFILPPELIAQVPLSHRDQSRLLVVNRKSGALEHRLFPELLQHLHPGDLLVLNNSRVIPARLEGLNAKTQGAFEILLLEQNSRNDWWVMLRPGKRARPGTEIVLADLRGNLTEIKAVVVAQNDEGHRRLQFNGTLDLMQELERLGRSPLPPYIKRRRNEFLESDRERYQTVFAAARGSVAAPTAGLHFTEALLHEIRAGGVELGFITLHVGLGTFAPVKSDTLGEHRMHQERFEISEAAYQNIRRAKKDGRRVIAVGTTTVRVLETLAVTDPDLIATSFRAANHPGVYASSTRIFIYPPYPFRVVDALLTNFHLPRSTLLMLVSAFAAPESSEGRELVLTTYAEAIRRQYRFFSYGDAMLLL